MKTPAMRLWTQNIQHWWRARQDVKSGTGVLRVSELLENKSLATVFQPMVDLRTGAILGHEALIRMPRTVGDMTYEQLLEAAKEQRCQRQFEMACVELAIEHWLVERPKGQLFVNFSAYTLVQLHESDSIDTLLQVLRKHKLQPKRMGLDITGYTRLPSITTLVEAVKPLREAGMAIALDDFKVSDSGMRVWTKLLPSIVKMAPRWTHKVDTESENSAMVASMVRLTQNHDCLLLAKSVETESELRTLRGLGVDLAQGFFLGSPAPDPISSLNLRARGVLTGVTF
jgi:EAL domain-containing protein (putative c-di-GMP-specific phosphodiesterase class I)